MRRWIPLILLGIGFATYHNSFNGPFIFDDFFSIRDNPNVRYLWPLQVAASAPSQSPVAGRPVVSLSLALNYAISGLDVWSYHLFNVAVHLLAALLLYGIVRRTLDSETLGGRYQGESPWLAMVVAGIWMAHPLLSEGVNYITQRTELLAGFFSLLTLDCFIRSLSSPRRSRWQTAAVVSCALGMGSKEVMVFMPLIVLLYDRAFVSSSIRRAIQERAGLYVGLACTWIVLAVLVVGGHRNETVGFDFPFMTPTVYALTQCGVILRYLRLAIWPTPLVLDYLGWPLTRTLGEGWPELAMIVVLLVATGLALWRRPRLGFLGACFFLILAPSSSVIPIVSEVASERRMYLPLISVVALAVLSGWAFVKVVVRNAEQRRSIAFSIAVVATAVLSIHTIMRNSDYQSAVTIWQDTVDKLPENARAHNNLGIALADEGSFDQAIVRYNEALRLLPEYALARNNLAVALSRRGRIGEAIQQYELAVQKDPANADTHYNLGTALGRFGRIEDAIRHLSKAVRLSPSHAEAHHNLGFAYARSGNYSQAAQSYQRAIDLQPGFARAHYNLAVSLTELGEIDEAVQHLETARDLGASPEQVRQMLDALQKRKPMTQAAL